MIFGRYTLFTRIPLYIGSDDTVHTDPLWAKDLELHTHYIDQLIVCSPALSLARAPSDVAQVKGLTRDQVVPIRLDKGWGSVFANVLPNFWAVHQALKQTDIAHTGGAGWAFPLSFYVLPLRLFITFKWIVVIESWFWMKPRTRKPSWREAYRHFVYTTLLGRCLRSAEARIFTQSGYRRFFSIREDRSLINPAVWVDEDQIISRETHAPRCAALAQQEVRFLFPARLIPDKGVDTVLQAIEALPKDFPELSIHVDIMGEGPLRDRCEEAADKENETVSLRVLDVVPYGPAFLATLREYHAILLANQQDEQPRIVFDAFSQGVPVISTETDGVRDIVSPDENAILYPIGDGTALAAAMVRLATDTTLALRLSDGARETSLGYSHEAMHRTREAFLLDALGQDQRAD